jgi:hypothetical protein
MIVKTGLRELNLFNSKKKSSYHSGIKRSPYSALFRNEARVGLTSSTLPREILENLESEDDLARLDLSKSPLTTASSVNAHNSTANTNLISSEPVAFVEAHPISSDHASSENTNPISSESAASNPADLISEPPIHVPLL